MPYGRNVVISRLWFLSPYTLRLTLYALGQDTWKHSFRKIER